MAKYTKKPVTIEAVQWTGDNIRQIFDFLTCTVGEPIRAKADNFYINHGKVNGGLVIKTLEGERIASIGEWVIKGVKGEYYPCKPDVFEATYVLSVEA